ncbi:Y-family DNA polymerase [Alcaligenes sp. WGS1538]|uniref:Y-family DNA polymerase n=1 Tax=Alcaligenes sp. WGS1538 TaxID=3366811 RepID=UPI00372D5D68
MSPWLCLPLSGNSTSPDACREQVQAVLPLLLRYSPQLAQPQPGVLLQNLGASLMLFGGLRTLYARIRQDLQPLLPGLRPALASTARGAWMLALAPGRQRRCLRRLQPRLDALPVDLLGPSPDELRWLHSLGCRRLGQLRQLPRDGLAQRGLRDLLLRLDQAYGERELVLDWLQAPPAFQLALDLDYSSRASGPLLHGLQRLLHTLEQWLEQRQLASGQLLVLLQAERRRDHLHEASLNIQMARSCWRSQDFLPLLQERLLQIRLDAPIQRLELQALQLHPRKAQPSSLFPDARHWQEQDQRLLERLQARLGAEQVLVPAPQASHLPEQANQWRPALAGTHSACPVSPALSRPVWMLESAQPLTHDQNAVWLEGRRLRLVQGPERLQTGWWTPEGHQQRDYFVAQDDQGRRYWVYRDLGQEQAWYLHGVFG